MSDYISRAELLKEIENTSWDTEGDKAEAHYIATQIEPADVQEVTHGRWVMYNGLYFCSVCKETKLYKTPYCSNCGAKMDEEVDNDKNTE